MKPYKINPICANHNLDDNIENMIIAIEEHAIEPVFETRRR